jgi:hypothetical protein
MAADDAFANMQGWDATITIPEPGADPFAGVSDANLLAAHPGVLAATVMAQSNQMRILDSSIVPDSALVYRADNPTGKFNEFTVSTPKMAPERYVITNEAGEDEEIIPPEAFYPGLAARDDAAPTALSTELGTYAGNPIAVMLATGAALLQLGVEAGQPVTGMAELLNRAWGIDGLFSADTIAALSGSSSYAEIFGRDRMVDARRLSSWQNQTFIRSGQLTMTADDWGDGLHCDFRRVRVAAESLFSATVTMESGKVKRSGQITYFVPSTTLLSADPSYLWPHVIDPTACAKSPKMFADDPVIKAAESVGLLTALWPSKDPVIAASWAATFAATRGLSSEKMAKRYKGLIGGVVVGHATHAVMRFVGSVARGVGRTHATSLSAKLFQLATNSPNPRVLGWLARFMAIVDVLHLYTDRSSKKFLAAMESAWRQLRGDFARRLEQATADEDMHEMNRLLPKALRREAGARSSRVLVTHVLWELCATRNYLTHTYSRAMKKAVMTSMEDAMFTRVSAGAYNPAGLSAAWVGHRFSVLREFWASRYGAIGAAATVGAWLPGTVRWWVEGAAVVSAFRAAYMRGISIATDGRARAGSVTVGSSAAEVTVYAKPYHAAAAFRRQLSALIAVKLPEFGPSDSIVDWLAAIGTRYAPAAANRYRQKPAMARYEAAVLALPTLRHSMKLLTTPGALALWAEDAFTSATADVATMLSTAAAATEGTLTRIPTAANTRTAAEAALAIGKAVQGMAAVIESATNAQEVSDLYEIAENLASDDAWDEFILAVELEEHAEHDRAAMMMETLVKATAETTAHMVAEWVNANFSDEEETEATQTGGAVN